MLNKFNTLFSLGQPSKPLINLYLNNQLEKEEVRQTNDGIKEFENIYLKCTTKYGYPFPEMKWFKNNIEMYVQTNLCIMKYDRIYLLN